jgi:hypothetical protein
MLGNLPQKLKSPVARRDSSKAPRLKVRLGDGTTDPDLAVREVMNQEKGVIFREG